MGTLTIENVSVRFGGVTALDDFSAQVEPGEVCGLIGPNGAGKTTLFNTVTRLVMPTRGSITFDGTDLLATPAHQIIRLGVARTFQNLSLWPTLSVIDNVRLGGHTRSPVRFRAEICGWPPARRADRRLRAEAEEILEIVELTDVADAPAGGLPFGTRKRIELARALASHPRLLLLDEPAGGLTQGEVTELGALISRVCRASDLSALLVEHHMGLVMGISDRVIAMENGHKIAEGTPEEIRSNPAVIDAYLGRVA
jgi:branched-chain amino acid transport system ATP-binding protein